MEIDEITPRDDLENILFNLLRKPKDKVLNNAKKTEYKNYFLKESNDKFIENLPYDVITKYIYKNKIFDPSGIESTITGIIELIIVDTNSNDSQKQSAEKCLRKIVRHIHLALVQYDFIIENIKEKESDIQSINESIADIKRSTKEAQSSLNDFSKNLDDKVKEVEKSINGNQLAILSIFAGIVTTFIGGFGVSINVFSNLINKVPMSKIIISASILFIGISCVIFLLLVTAARIVNHNLFFENNKRTLVLVIRLLALICLGAALVYQLEFSKENHIMIKQGIWFEQYAKWIEIGITVLMIGIAAIPKPIFKLHRWIEKKIRD
ncbi:hypothetical protein E5555_05505 [Lactococcus lactis]|uniref:hypothetical protein n=1 Tax=Lactococcus lactis TaxID=1358 RepID=UPI00109C5B76|nr:hypothetical protein [Lactococcus lactis]THA54570.1 hypothetical protein E5555_05505 [Lactococcus lactis]